MKTRSFISTLALSATIIIPFILAVGATAAIDEGCTPAQQAQALTDIDEGCVASELAGSVIPAGTPEATVAADVEVACGLADTALPDLVKIIDSFESTAAPAVGATYKPAPWAVPKIAARRARTGS